ncbi:MAG: hypothetical protein LBV73_21855 [Paraburkholderia sp.]|jgi:type IV pilus biogenesis protein CpaD/CtpE|nr:hypothetical protein [Paraburkholderia sp.]
MKSKLILAAVIAASLTGCAAFDPMNPANADPKEARLQRYAYEDAHHVRCQTSSLRLSLGSAVTDTCSTFRPRTRAEITQVVHMPDDYAPAKTVTVMANGAVILTPGAFSMYAMDGAQ